MANRMIYWIGGGFILLLSIVVIYYYKSHQQNILPTYFTYNTKEVEQLRHLTSSHEISNKELKDWDELTSVLIKKNKLGDKDVSRLYAYLYTGQTDVAFLSLNESGQLMGSVAPISAAILPLFFPNDTKMITDLEYSKELAGDKYTSLLTDIVYKKIKERWQADLKQTIVYPEKKSPDYWMGKKPYFGQESGSWKTWYLQKGSQFRAPAPPVPNAKEWDVQLKMTHQALKSITPEQKIAAVRWAGGPGTMTPPGQWLILADTYMSSQNLPLSKILEVRATLARTIADAVIAVFDSKYTYWVKRPDMLDPSIHTVMPTPDHPSYPAGHSTISAASAMILDFYFPEEHKYWLKNETEASHSRIWGGIHFQIDAEAGKKLGTEVAQEALKKEKQKQSSAPDRKLR